MAQFHFRQWEPASFIVSGDAVPIDQTPHYFLAKLIVQRQGILEKTDQFPAIENTREYADYEVYAAHENGCKLGCRDPKQAAQNFSDWYKDGLNHDWHTQVSVTSDGYAAGAGDHFQILDGAHRIAFAAACRNVSNECGAFIEGIYPHNPSDAMMIESPFPPITGRASGPAINDNRYDDLPVGAEASSCVIV